MKTRQITFDVITEAVILKCYQSELELLRREVAKISPETPHLVRMRVEALKQISLSLDPAKSDLQPVLATMTLRVKSLVGEDALKMTQGQKSLLGHFDKILSSEFSRRKSHLILSAKEHPYQKIAKSRSL